ncbi:MAG: hypothetical protein JXP34_08015 [Planctomycetes bacterium]|nr:hypothetical protein [Planctomycetota bacterium]
MLNRLKDVFRCFERHDVRYLVIGGIASVLHGVPRATFDLDILVEGPLRNVERLLAALLEAGLGTAALTTPADVLAHETTVFRDRVRIDVQTSTPGLRFEDAWKRHERMEYEGQVFRVVSEADLIASKRAAGQPVDLEEVRLLEVPDQEPGP